MQCPLSGGDGKEETKRPSRPSPRITVSKETTRLLGPLTPEGFVDYAAALDAELRRGVTRENNGAVLFFEALGPGAVAEESREGFFRRLGMPLPAQGGEYFRSLSRFLEDDAADGMDYSDLVDDRHHALRSAWTPDDHPEIAAWIAANAKPLDRIAAATRKEHWYEPRVPLAGDVGSLAWRESILQLGEVAKALAVRATLSLGESKSAAAVDDFLACLRLGRLWGRGAFGSFEARMALAASNVVADGLAAFALSEDLDAAVLGRVRKELRALEPPPPLVDSADAGCRYSSLDLVGSLALGKPGAARALGELLDDGSEVCRWLRRVLRADDIEADAALREVNLAYDRWIEACRGDSYAVRQTSLRRVQHVLEQAGAKRASFRWLLTFLSREERTRQLANAVALSEAEWLGESLAVEAAVRARLDLVTVALALEAQSRARGAYPEELDSVRDAHLEALPLDPYTGTAYRYRREGRGYVLSSPGPDGADALARVIAAGRRELDEDGGGRPKRLAGFLEVESEDHDDVVFVGPGR